MVLLFRRRTRAEARTDGRVMVDPRLRGRATAASAHTREEQELRPFNAAGFLVLPRCALSAGRAATMTTGPTSTPIMWFVAVSANT